MPTSTSTSTSVEAVCRIASYVLHPAVVMLGTTLVLSARAGRTGGQVAMDGAVLVLGLAPPIAYILFRTARGEFDHHHLLRREERTWVFPLGIVCLVGAVALYRALGSPATVVRSALVGVVGGSGAAAINFFYKMSVHAAVAAGCAVVLAAVSPIAGAMFGVVAVTSGVCRVPIGHHDWPQVIIGWAYGAVVSGALVVLLDRFA